MSVLNELTWNGRLYWAPKVHGSYVDSKLVQDQGHTNTSTGLWVKDPQMLRLEAVGNVGTVLSNMKRGQLVRVSGKLRFFKKTGVPYIQVVEIEDATIRPLLA